MARKRSTIPADKPVTPIHVFANEMAELMAIIRPWFIWLPLVIGAALLRFFWPDNFAVVGFLGAVVIAIPALIWVMDAKDRNIPYFVHTVLSAIVIAGTLGYIDLCGYAGHRYVGLFLLLFGIPLLCLTWSIRGAITEKHEAQGTHLQDVFEQAGMPNTALKIHPHHEDNSKGKKEKVKKEKVKRTHKWSMRMGDDEPEPIKAEVVTEPEAGPEAIPTGKVRRTPIDRRIKGTVTMDPGMTHDDMVDNIRRVESAGGFPPGSFVLAPNLDHAGKTDVIISDPRIIKQPIFYPGPSFIGGSVADPISIGTYQDGTECEWNICHTMTQIMGMINSGKSLGGGWSIGAELITRNDCVIWAADVTKGYQTLGPLAPAIHRIETTPKGARLMLEDLNSLIKPRTNYLAEHGFGKWQKGCGLNYLVVWLEEIPDIVRDIGTAGKDLWIRSVKNGRSAGITILWSLQRSDFTQVPTIARGQGAKMCFGVADPHEAKFGLSSAQKDAGCTPELWGQRQQGMCYLDAPGIPEDYLAMPLRTWYWGEDDSIIKAHAAKYPISDRPYDDLMVKTLGVHTPAPMEATPTVVEPLDTNDARMIMRTWIIGKKGQEVTNKELFEQAKQTGYTSRGWAYKVMHEFEDEKMISRIEQGKWMVNEDFD